MIGRMARDRADPLYPLLLHPSPVGDRRGKPAWLDEIDAIGRLPVTRSLLKEAHFYYKQKTFGQCLPS
jgi:hypothetical protein